jgi:hypothetical protein
MSLPSGILIANGNAADGAILRTDLESIDTRVTALETTTKFPFSRITFDTSVPPSALPAFGTADGISVENRQSSNAGDIQALGLPFVRRHPTTDMQLADLRAPAAAYGGFVVPQATAGGTQAIHWWVHDEASGGFRLRTYSLASTDTPEWCAAAKSGIIYVSCTGTLKIRKVNTKDGVVSDFVNLGTFNTGHASGAVNGINKVIVNRHGTFLYVIGKRTADATLRRVFQVRVSTGAIIEWSLAADERVADLALLYSGTVSSTDGTLCALQSAAASNELFRTLENAFGTTTSSIAVGTVAGETWRSMVTCGNRLVLAKDIAGTCWFSVIVYDETMNLTAVSSYNTLVATTPYFGAITTDGEYCYALSTVGGIMPFNAASEEQALYSVTWRARFVEAAPVAAQGGICWTGRMFVAVLPKTTAEIAASRSTICTR